MTRIRINEQTVKQMDRQSNEWTEFGQMDRQTNKQTKMFSSKLKNTLKRDFIFVISDLILLTVLLVSGHDKNCQYQQQGLSKAKYRTFSIEKQ